MEMAEGRGLKFLREKRGDNQRETAQALNLNYKRYNHFELGRRRPADYNIVLRMAEHFNVSVEEMMWHLGYEDEHETEDIRSSSRAASTA